MFFWVLSENCKFINCSKFYCFPSTLPPALFHGNLSHKEISGLYWQRTSITSMNLRQRMHSQWVCLGWFRATVNGTNSPLINGHLNSLFSACKCSLWLFKTHFFCSGFCSEHNVVDFHYRKFSPQIVLKLLLISINTEFEGALIQLLAANDQTEHEHFKEDKDREKSTKSKVTRQHCLLDFILESMETEVRERGEMFRNSTEQSILVSICSICLPLHFRHYRC